MAPSRDTAGYPPFAVEFYDYVAPYRGRADVPFYVEAARRSKGPVLEIGSGTGRILIPIARAGVEVVGLELSEEMLAACREKLAHEPPDVQGSVQLVQGDMRQFDLWREFGLVSIPFRGFQHLLTVEDQLACFSSIRRHLPPGGGLVLDVFNPSLPRLVDERYLNEVEEEPEFSLPDGRKVVRRNRVVSRDLARQVLESELIYYVKHADGKQERLVHRFSLRYLFRFEAEHLLERTGFRVEQLYSDYDKSPYGSKYPGELLFVASKV